MHPLKSGPRWFRLVCFSWLVMAGMCLCMPAAVAESTLFVFAQPRAQESAEASIVIVDGETENIPAAAAEMPLLVNEQYPLDAGYIPDDLVLMAEYCDDSIVKIKGSEIQGQRGAVDALMTMLRDAVAGGVKNWQVSSGYRSVQYQQEMWDNRVYRYRKEDGMSGSQARAAAGRFMATPGASEHHTGLAFDITVPGQDSFVSTKQCKWLQEHCWEYGFIVRYTADKQSITGINAEPWHIRYVGLPHSLLMQASGECLEEYLEMTGE